VLVIASIVGLSAGWIALAAAGAGAVVAAHLIARRTLPRVEFPIARFIQRADARSARPRLLRDALLVLTRALLIALLALAFDRLAWTTVRPVAADSRDLVIVLDASASMTRSDAGGTYFEQARRSAIERIEAATSAGRSGGVVLARRTPETLLPTLTRRASPVLDALAGIDATLERAQLEEAIRLAAEMPNPSSEEPRPRRIVVLTDRQRSQWDDVALADLPELVGVEVVSIGDAPAMSNLALSEPVVTVHARDVEVAATVWNSGLEPIETIVTLETSIETQRRAIGLTPDEGATVSFTLDATAESARLSAPPDRFPHDDALVIPVDRAGRARVAVVAPQAAWSDRWSAAPYIASAIDLDGAGPFDIVRLAPGDLPAAALEGFEAIVLAEPGLAGAELSALQRFIDAGGRAFFFGDAPPLSRLGIRTAAEDAPSDAPFRLTVEDSSAAFQSRLHPLDEPDTRILARFDDGAPALIERRIGEGAVVALLAPIDPESSSLVRTPGFPAMLHELIGASDAADLVVAHVGEPLTIPLRGDVLPPLTDNFSRRVVIGGVAGAHAALVEGAERPGMIVVRDASGAVGARALVTLDPRESDAAIATEEEIARALGEADAKTPMPAMMTRTERVELWPFLLISVGGLCSLETLLARRAPRRRTPRLEGALA